MSELNLFTEQGILEIGQLILNYLHRCKITVDGKEQEKEIYKKNIEGNKINIHLMLDDTIVGNIEKISVISIKGTEVLRKIENINKNTDKGLLISFPIKIIEDYQGSEVR